MKRKLVSSIVLVFVLGCVVGCAGGGGGVPIEKEIVVSSIDIDKEEFQTEDGYKTKKELLFWNTKKDSNSDEVYDSVTNSEFKVDSHKYHLPTTFLWKEKVYVIACGDGGSFGIFDSENNLMTRIETSRYTTGMVVFPMKDSEGNEKLVVFMKYQTTARSSSLFIFDEEFKVVYQENLEDGHWIARNDEDNIFYLNTGTATPMTMRYKM